MISGLSVTVFPEHIIRDLDRDRDRDTACETDPEIWAPEQAWIIIYSFYAFYAWWFHFIGCKPRAAN